MIKMVITLTYLCGLSWLSFFLYSDVLSIYAQSAANVRYAQVQLAMDKNKQIKQNQALLLSSKSEVNLKLMNLISNSIDQKL